MLAPWKKSYDQSRQHIKKHKHYFANKVHLVKALVFPVIMYGGESWTLKKAEHQRIDAFEPWYCRRFLRVPWTVRRSNQSIPKGNQSWVFTGRIDVEAETLILWPPDAKSWLIWKELMLGKIEGRRRRGWQRMRWLDGITDSTDMSWVNLDSEGQGSLACCHS